jgi:hypothetical protein
MAWYAAMIVKVATSKKDRLDWAYDKKKDEFGENTNKCNKFVYDVMVEAGVTPPPQVTVSRLLIFSKTRLPTAGEWADKTQTITGWVVVADPQPGDVVAEAHDYSDATGHCGVVVGDKQTASASSLVNGMIVINDWGFRADNKPTFRRCTLAPTPAPAPGASPPSPPPPK